ncbi:DUF1338 domain-containing protein [Halomonas cupida]|uniref:DUF1338 domain-containing protein n=1 Tax=Halomonas cupida TaxID=44933 RepID=UPI003A949A33
MTEQQTISQQLWLDFIHQHPEIGALRLWPVDTPLEYLVLATISQSPWSMAATLSRLAERGYRPTRHYALADRGLLVTLLAGDIHSPRLIVIELQTTRLSSPARAALQQLTSGESSGSRTELGACRPWPMPDWATYQLLRNEHPLAGWLAAMGPRVHHVGYDCTQIGKSLAQLDSEMQEHGFMPASEVDEMLPVSPLIEHRYYPNCSRRLAFADGDEHRITAGAIQLVRQAPGAGRERTADVLLPPYAWCEMS